MKSFNNKLIEYIENESTQAFENNQKILSENKLIELLENIH
jgi:hypothetical protein